MLNLTPIQQRLLCTQLLFVFCLCFLSMQGHGKNLIEVLDALFENDPNWKSQLYEYQSRQQSKNIGRASILPSLLLNGEHKQVNDEIDCPPNQPNCNEDPYISTSYQIELSQTLFNVQNWRAYQEAKANTTDAEIEFQNTYQEFLLQTAEDYFAVMEAKDTLYLRLLEFQALDEQVQSTAIKSEAGLLSKTVVIETEASADLAKIELISQHHHFVRLVDQLKTRAGIDNLYLHKLNHGALKIELPYNDEEQWVKAAKKNSVYLKAIEQSYLLAQQSFKKNTSQAYPSLDFFANYSSREQDGGVFVQNGTSESIGLRLSVPLFVGLGDYYTNKEQKLKFAQHTEDIHAQKTDFFSNLRNEYRSVNSLLLTLKAREKNKESTRRAKEAVEIQYKRGTRSISDLLSAQNNAFTSEQDYINALYNYLTSSLRLKLLAGVLKISDLEEVNTYLSQDLEAINILKEIEGILNR